MNIKTRLLQALDADKQEHIDLLQKFVRAPSPNPPGDTLAAAAVIKTYLSKRGIPFDVIDPQNNEQPNIVSEFEGGAGPGPRVVLNGHIDVFPVGDGHGWARDPWSGDIEGDRIHGRGVVDMKSGTISLVLAYVYLYERREYLAGSVALCAVSDEETGGKWGTKYLIEQDKRRWGGDVMLSSEPTSITTIRFAEKGTLRLSVYVTTKGAHGAYLNLSKGAIRTAAAFIGEVIDAVEGLPVSLPDEMAEHLRRPDVIKAIDEAMGEGTAAIIARPTVNVGTIKGGLKVNMIPDSCQFELDIRLPVGLVAETVLETLDSLTPHYPDATIKVEKQVAASNPSSFSPIHHPIVDCIASNAAAMDSKLGRPLPVPSMGATDGKHYRRAGIPCYEYGPSPISMAAVDESGSIAEFLHITKVQAAATWDFLQPSST